MASTMLAGFSGQARHWLEYTRTSSLRISVSRDWLFYLHRITATTDDGQSRHAFALDYRLHIHNLTLSVSGTEVSLYHSNGADTSSGPVEVTQSINVTARIGNDDGANPPWFPIADSILLFWWIHKEDATIPLMVKWISEEDDGLRRLELWSTVSRVRFDEPLLVIQKKSNDTSKIFAIAPTIPGSSSPTLTYPLRIAIISLLAPSSIFINDLIGGGAAFIFSSTMMVLFYLFVVLGYILLAIAVALPLWVCVRRWTHGNGEWILDYLRIVGEVGRRLLRVVITYRRSNQRPNRERIPEHEEAKYSPNREAARTRSKSDIEMHNLDG